MRVRAAFAAAGVVSLTLSVAAHHSHGQYDETFRDIEGVVKELHLLTPHSWLYIEVKDAKGAPELWALEATTRAQLEGIGVTRDSLKPGDVIKARCHPLQGQEQRVPPGISEDHRRNGQGLGRREGAAAQGLLANHARHCSRVRSAVVDRQRRGRAGVGRDTRVSRTAFASISPANRR